MNRFVGEIVAVGRETVEIEFDVGGTRERRMFPADELGIGLDRLRTGQHVMARTELVLMDDEEESHRKNAELLRSVRAESKESTEWLRSMMEGEEEEDRLAQERARQHWTNQRDNPTPSET